MKVILSGIVEPHGCQGDSWEHRFVTILFLFSRKTDERASHLKFRVDVCVQQKVPRTKLIHLQHETEDSPS